MSLFPLSGNCPGKTPEEIQHSRRNHFVTREADLTREVEEFHLRWCWGDAGPDWQLLGEGEDTSFAAQKQTTLEPGAGCFQDGSRHRGGAGTARRRAAGTLSTAAVLWPQDPFLKVISDETSVLTRGSPDQGTAVGGGEGGSGGSRGRSGAGWRGRCLHRAV